MSRSRPAVVVLSPHFDDAPLSLGQSMLNGELASERVVVGIIFGRTNWQRWFHPTPRRTPIVSAIRRAEEMVNARRFGYRCRVARLPEVILRTGEMDSATFLDPSSNPIPDDLDGSMISDIEAVIQPWISGADRIIAPLGVGGHLDHRLVREAARGLVDADRLEFYEDRPYASYASDDFIATLASNVDPAIVAHDMSSTDTRNKASTTWYPSQFDQYFVNAMTADHDAGRAERVWRQPR